MVSPNTLDAHRAIHWAGGQSPEIQNRLVERLFQIYFLEGGHLGDDAVSPQPHADRAAKDEIQGADVVNECGRQHGSNRYREM